MKRYIAKTPGGDFVVGRVGDHYQDRTKTDIWRGETANNMWQWHKSFGLHRGILDDHGLIVDDSKKEKHK